jgi:hypothetical protein
VIALTQKDVLAHEVVVPWSEPYQVEQDLLLCLAMRAIFEDLFLSGQVAKAVASIFLLRDEPMKRTKWLAGYAFTFVAPVGQS